MIAPNSLVQLTNKAVEKFLKEFSPDTPFEPDTKERRGLLRDVASYDYIFRHMGVLYLSPMSDHPECGVFATHEGTIKWGMDIADFEPFNAADHGEEVS